MLGEVGHTEPQGHCWVFYDGSFGTSTVVHGWCLTSRGSYKSDGLEEDGTNTPSHCFLKAGASGPSQPVSLPVAEHYYTSKGSQVTWLGRRLL